MFTCYIDSVLLRDVTEADMLSYVTLRDVTLFMYLVVEVTFVMLFVSEWGAVRRSAGVALRDES